MDELLTLAVKHRRALHLIPEVGFELPETQAYVLNALRDTGAKIETLSPCGVLAYFDFGKKDTLALRADMDALPIEEMSGVEFCSTHPGKMHACGHDAHMAMLLTVAGHLRFLDPPTNILLIFQPAEESGCGATVVIDSGALEKYNVKRIYACHVEPSVPSGVITTRPGAFMAMTSEVHVTVKGQSSHIARPDRGIDALMAAVRFVDRSKELIERKYADVTHLYGYGRFVSGTANNIISDETTLAGVLRSFDEGVFNAVLSDIRQVASDVTGEIGAAFSFRLSTVYPPVINDKDCYEELTSLTGALPFRPLEKPWLIAEDFACYLKRVPGLMFQLGLNTPTPLHSREFRFEESALLNGIRMFLALVSKTPAQ